MSEQPPQQPSGQQGTPAPPAPQYERDPFPKMIIVCIVISIVLFFVIAATLLYDFSLRTGQAVPMPVFNVETPAPTPSPTAPAPAQ